jgi:AhpD family alkylhydroperoxidase
MEQRLDYVSQSPELYRELIKLSGLSKKSPVTAEVGDLVQIRASQLNGCAFCLDMHVKEAKLHGERELRVHHIAIWRESDLFSARERAALEWTEAVTKLGEHGVPDDVYARVREQFSDKEVVDLTYSIIVINAWNRLAIPFRVKPGSRDAEYGLDKAGLT